MKHFIPILGLIFFVTLLDASASVDHREKEKTEKEKDNNPDKDKTELVDTDLLNSGTSREERQGYIENSNDPDSSYYSVNKFNYLFYFVYKLKYLSDEVSETELGMEP